MNRRRRAAHIDLPGVCSSLIAGFGAELVYASGSPSMETMRVDASHWPPKVVVDKSRYVLDAARGRDASWLFHTRTERDGRRLPYELVRAAGVVADYDDARTVDVPFARADIRALFPRLKEPNIGIELAHDHALSQVALVGTRAVLVPRNVGFGDRRRLFVERAGTFIEDASLPQIVPDAVAKDADDEGERDAARARFRGACWAVHLDDGRDLLLTPAGLFVDRGDVFERAMEKAPQPTWWHHFEPVAVVSQAAFFCADENQHLVEVRVDSGDVVVHHDRSEKLARGPRGTLVVMQGYHEPALYDPVARTLTKLPEELIGGDDVSFAFANADGDLVVGGGFSPPFLRRIEAHELASLTSTIVARPGEERAPEARAEGAVIEVTPAGTFSTSRPHACVLGARLVVPRGDVLRAYRYDDAARTDCPDWKKRIGAAIVAVAATKKHIVAVAVAVADPADAGAAVTAFTIAGKRAFEVSIDDAPRSMCAHAAVDVACVLGTRALHLVDGAGEARAVPFDLPVAAAFSIDGDGAEADDVDGTATDARTPPHSGPHEARSTSLGTARVAARARRLFVVGNHRRAAVVDVAAGRLTPVGDAPEEMHAVAALAGNRFAVLGQTARWTFSVDAGWELAHKGMPGDHIASIAVDDGITRLATMDSAGTVAVVDVRADGTQAEVTTCTWPSTFSDKRGAEEDVMRVRGLAFRGPERLLVALGDGQASLLHIDTKAAEKLDPYPKEPHRSWVFIYGGSILVAGR